MIILYIINYKILFLKTWIIQKNKILIINNILIIKNILYIFYCYSTQYKNNNLLNNYYVVCIKYFDFIGSYYIKKLIIFDNLLLSKFINIIVQL